MPALAISWGGGRSGAGRRLVSRRRLAAAGIRQMCLWLTCRTRSGRAS